MQGFVGLINIISVCLGNYHYNTWGHVIFTACIRAVMRWTATIAHAKLILAFLHTAGSAHAVVS